MKKIYIAIMGVLIGSLLFSACKNDHSYPDGLPQFEHHYYAGFLPWNNTKVTVTRNQTTLVKFPVQFHSEFVRGYNAVAQYTLVTTGIATPAQPGVDFDIVDKNGATIQPSNGVYNITFAQAKKGTDTIYVKLLNNPEPGIRSTEINMVKNTTTEYTVGIFNDAYRRPLEIR